MSSRLQLLRRNSTRPCRLPAIVIVACALGPLAGCAGDTKEHGKVHGRVTSSMKPVVEAVVLFEDPQQHVYLQATTDMEGRYDFAKFPGGGLPVGTYRVAVQPPIQEIRTGEPLPPPKPFPKVDSRFLNPAASGLQLQVTSGDNPYDIELPAR